MVVIDSIFVGFERGSVVSPRPNDVTCGFDDALALVDILGNNHIEIIVPDKLVRKASLLEDDGKSALVTIMLCPVLLHKGPRVDDP